jgi:phosphate transport system protein
LSRESFHAELNQLVEDLLGLGDEVKSTLANMVAAMESGDPEVCRKELGVDARLKLRGAEIDEECMILQARQAPVARDLRLLYTVQTVTNHLVRAGTLGEHICRVVVDTAEEEKDESLQEVLLQMARSARELMERGLAVFKSRDIDGARDLQAMDDKVDLLYTEAMNLIANPNADGGGSPEWRAKAALVVHYLERIADHGVSLGGRTVFLVTGERIENAMLQYRQRGDSE